MFIATTEMNSFKVLNMRLKILLEKNADSV